jgi:hypothetical protein
MNEPTPNIPSVSAEVFGCIGAIAAAAVIPVLAVLISISDPSRTLTFVWAWNWAALGLAFLNTAVCISLLRRFNRVKALWLVVSSFTIILSCPHFRS